MRTVFDTYLDREHPEFDPDEEACAHCGGPIETREDHAAWLRGRLCPGCWDLFKEKTRHREPPACPFPWMGDRCSRNRDGECTGDYASMATRNAWAGLKWWVTDYERCLQDYEAIIRLMRGEAHES